MIFSYKSKQGQKGRLLVHVHALGVSASSQPFAINVLLTGATPFPVRVAVTAWHISFCL
jgi:hypothetical protein